MRHQKPAVFHRGTVVVDALQQQQQQQQQQRVRDTVLEAPQLRDGAVRSLHLPAVQAWDDVLQPPAAQSCHLGTIFTRTAPQRVSVRDLCRAVPGPCQQLLPVVCD